jgi:ABC-type uncharacterized transport system substrate-binding protein
MLPPHSLVFLGADSIGAPALMRSVPFALLLALGLASPAAAHPHVFVTSKSEIVYDGKGSVTGVRQAWTFDEMFSSFAVQGLDTNNDGALSREELQPLAQTNVESLKEYDYFTYAKLGGRALSFEPPVDYWLEQKDKVLTLHFFLPLAQPQAQAQKPLAVEIYDPSYFVAFEMAPEAPVVLAGAPTCAVDIRRPKDLDDGQKSAAASLDQGAFDAVETGFGAQFANVALVNCP